ncbi:hypothetical protein NDN08_008159 [Rhodosorus marinus]|uniref:Uncharacterized protein n=1 Tax=Rhodosorus marinus TaxID=101924 RepID=A0AAV8V3I7_9RHOD|nr:hypothetical protein NDN08_008159 [Rhodosorus marinus]
MGKKKSSALDYGDLFGENGFNVEALERAKAKEAAAQKKRAELRREELRKKQLQRKQGSAPRPSRPFVSEGRSGLSLKAEQAQLKAQEARRKLEEKKRHKEEKMQLANMKPKDVRASSKHKSSWEKIQGTIDPKSRPRKDDTRARKKAPMEKRPRKEMVHIRNQKQSKREQKRGREVYSDEEVSEGVDEDIYDEDEYDSEDDGFIVDDLDDGGYSRRPQGLKKKQRAYANNDDEEDPNDWRAEMAKVVGRRRRRFSDDDDLDDDEDEDEDEDEDDGGFESVMREEERSAKLAKLEDRRELAAENERKRRKALRMKNRR